MVVAGPARHWQMPKQQLVSSTKASPLGKRTPLRLFSNALLPRGHRGCSGSERQMCDKLRECAAHWILRPISMV
jgi:hypothetical protein